MPADYWALVLSCLLSEVSSFCDVANCWERACLYLYTWACFSLGM
jgi:hypothetical protein